MLLHEALPLCYNRDRADDFCLRFCHHNSKSARRRLATALFEVPRQSLDLLPQYARIAATLDLVMKDLVPQLLAALQDEFRYFQRKKPSSHLEAKVKNVKYIGELVKFKVGQRSYRCCHPSTRYMLSLVIMSMTTTMTRVLVRRCAPPSCRSRCSRPASTSSRHTTVRSSDGSTITPLPSPHR